MKKFNEVTPLSISAIRALAIDTTNKAKSGHPGMAIGSAPILYTLFSRFLVSDPSNPTWIYRDRFVLSAGHASALLYSILHVSGYEISLDDLKDFRQLGSITPGHPEVHMTPGVDATTGPLGQGLAQAVGMAVAEERLRASFPSVPLGHFTYCLVGDGCLQEGISQEAISFAGHQKLNKLIVFYDANDVTLDGPLSDSFSEDVKLRFKASGWDVINVNDGNDYEEIARATRKAQRSKEKPTLIIVKTIIGEGSIKQGTSAVHGSPLGEEDGNRVKAHFNYNYPAFTIPSEVYDDFKETFIKRGKKAYRKFNRELKALKESDEKTYNEFMCAINNDVESYFPLPLNEFEDGFNESTRKTSGNIVNIVQNHIPFMIGGSADVAGSVMTKLTNPELGNFTPENRTGHNVNFGIREFAMAAIQNGILLHGGLRTYVGSFLVFSDYMKNAIRLAALSELPAIYLFSHDSVALGEDGPTHQPIEHLAMLRSLPNIHVWRPADSRETNVAWTEALKSKNTPNALILTRQNLLTMSGSKSSDVNKGGYVISKEAEGELDLTLIASGSEVNLALTLQERLKEKGLNARVVSLPCMEVFRSQDEEYKEEVFGVPYNRRVSLEMLSTFGWHEFSAHPFGVNRFGLSAPGSKAIEAVGFGVEELLQKILKIIETF